MKKNKFLLVSLLFLAIFLVQPQNFNFLKKVFTQNDLATQLNISQSPEEKMIAQQPIIKLKTRS